MSKIDTNRNKRIEQIDEEFQIAVQNAPAYDPFSPKGGEAWKKWADKCREIEADLAAEGVELL
jgi:hypothetical protein